MREELEGYDAIGLAELIRKGEVQVIEIMDDAIERIKKLNPKLNAVIFKDYDNARKQARACDARSLKEVSPHSPFYGVPFLLKDLLAEAKGLPSNEGSQFVDGLYLENRQRIGFQAKKSWFAHPGQNKCL